MSLLTGSMKRRAKLAAATQSQAKVMDDALEPRSALRLEGVLRHLAVATLVGAALNFTPIDMIRALFLERGH